MNAWNALVASSLFVASLAVDTDGAEYLAGVLMGVSLAMTTRGLYVEFYRLGAESAAKSLK